MHRAQRTNVLGRYRLIAELGCGGMAEVFLAVAQGPAGFNKLTVIKQIRSQLAGDPEFLAMFLDEARLAARLNHPNVVQTNEVGHDDSRYFIAMEYLEGQPLNRVLHRVKRDNFPLAMHLRVIADTLAGLHYAHDLTDYDGTPLEVVHRDVTPHNVFVTYDGQVKVVDFGIAKAMNSSAETRTGVLKGKIAYMAPEQARGERVDRRADIFSVGVMLWEAAVGRRLWKGMPDLAILGRLVAGDLPRPSAVRPDVLPELEAIILRAMAHDREERYRTAGELQGELERLLEQMGQPVSMREVGRLISQHFADERGKIRALVEAQLRDVRSLPTPTDEYRAVSLPVIAQTSSQTRPPPPEGSGPDYGSGPSYGSGPGSRSSPGSGAYGSSPGSGTYGSSPGSGAYASSLGSGYGSNPGYPRPDSLTGANTAMTSAARPRLALLVPLVLVGVVGLSAGIGLALRRSGEPAEPRALATTTATPAAQGQGATAAQAPGEIELKVKARPAEARLFLDDQPLPGNPAVRRAPRDGSVHALRVEAPGYLPDSRELIFSKDFDIELVLEKAPASAAQPAAAHPAGRLGSPPRQREPAREPTEGETDMKRPTSKPVRTLDTSDPFANP